jgi:uncharacterized protein (TIGR02391 family)
MNRTDKNMLVMLQAKIVQIDELEKSYSESAFETWHTETTLILEHIFGEKSEKVETFKRFDGEPSVLWSGQSDASVQRSYEQSYFSDLKAAKNFMKGLDSFLQKTVEDIPREQSVAVQKTGDVLMRAYSWHPAITEVSGALFSDGHYRDAVRSAIIEIIDQVKKKSGKPMRGGQELDGDALMNSAFGRDSKEPIIKWNSLDTRAEKDFQQGMMYPFKGLVALRNEKGHLNVEQKDREKAFEYLSFASLLMRELDESNS